MNVLITGARIPDFTEKRWIDGDLLALGGKIAAMGGEIPKKKSYSLLSAGGMVLLPAFTDLRTHVFAPPYIRVESGDTLRKTAAAGGYYTLLAAPCAPEPVISAEQVRAVASLSDPRKLRILPTGAIADREGRPSDAAALLDAGAFTLADDGFADLPTLRAAMSLCAARGRPFLFQAALPENDPFAMTQPGGGQAPFCENLAVARAIACADDTGCHLHVTGVSTAGAIRLIRGAKAAGIAVTCDSPPPYFTMTKSELHYQGSSVKLCHPLRERADMRAVLEGVIDGTVDAISTDHTPVERAQKQPLETAACGMLALQTAFSVCMTHLVIPGYIDLFRLIDLLSLAPLRILGPVGSDGQDGPDGPSGRMEEGAFCPLALCDPGRSYTFTDSMLKSHSFVRNSPYLGRSLTGTVEKLIL